MIDQYPEGKKRLAPQTSAFTSDNFYTDPAALGHLLPYLKPDWRIWEPACGFEKKPLVHALRLEGFGVIGTDIRRGESNNFLTHFVDPEGL